MFLPMNVWLDTLYIYM